MKDEIKTTDIWQMYQKGVDFLRLRNTYSNTDKHYRMVYGDQWETLPKGPVENVTYNILQPIVDYKVGSINANLWAINYSSENFDASQIDQKVAKDTCTLFNKHAARIWEKDDMDYKIYYLSEDAAIDSEGLIYVDFKDGEPVNELINKVDVCYGNENSSDIQNQPYIIIKTRKPVEQIKQLAKDNGKSDEDIANIVGDMDTLEEAGSEAKNEVNDMCILLIKLWKQDGRVMYSKSTKSVDIMENVSSGISLYPLEHFVWKQVKGSSRGVGEVQFIIPNQLEINKTAMRRALAVKQGAYPKQVINTKWITNPGDADKVGVTLKSNSDTVDDVRKLFSSTTPSSMSNDAKELQTEMITNTRDLANAGDAATGQIDPEQASGRAILAVQNASKQPLKKQERGLKRAIEGLARIYFEMWKAYTPDTGKILLREEEQIDPTTGKLTTVEVPYVVPKTVMEALKVNAKAEVTPKSAYDKYAAELSMENLANNQNFINTSWLEDYESLLEDDSIMSKIKIKALIERRKKVQQEIAQVQKEAAMLQGQVDNVINQQEAETTMTAPVMEEQPA